MHMHSKQEQQLQVQLHAGVVACRDCPGRYWRNKGACQLEACFSIIIMHMGTCD